ncbi:MAG TPA: XshC-Cox1-family protein, partial [Clostridiales bacterium UBA8960]|nr:XshC-Cox1-family protein [Clostridiales bacterium UBA8960]
VTEAAGSRPRDVGSMMIVDSGGHLIAGTIGGGKVEETAKQDAANCLRNKESKTFKYELTLKESEHSLGMACGGLVEVFVKTFEKRENLIIFGGGHIGLELSRFAKALGYRIIVVDQRPEYCSRSRFPVADELLLLDPENPPVLGIDADTSVVIVTHGHLYDMEALRLVIMSDARYIGMIGSRNKIRHCFAELIKEGISEERLNKVFAPIGLDVGGETPEEIALAILAEVQAVKYGRTGSFLKETHQ